MQNLNSLLDEYLFLWYSATSFFCSLLLSLYFVSINFGEQKKNRPIRHDQKIFGKNKRKLRINNIGPTNRQHITAKVFSGLQEFAKYIDLVSSLKIGLLLKSFLLIQFVYFTFFCLLMIYFTYD